MMIIMNTILYVLSYADLKNLHTSYNKRNAAGNYFVIWGRHVCLKITVGQRTFQENFN